MASLQSLTFPGQWEEDRHPHPGKQCPSLLQSIEVALLLLTSCRLEFSPTPCTQLPGRQRRSYQGPAQCISEFAIDKEQRQFEEPPWLSSGYNSALPMGGVQVWSLVKKLRSHKLHSVTERKNEDICLNPDLKRDLNRITLVSCVHRAPLKAVERMNMWWGTSCRSVCTCGLVYTHRVYDLALSTVRPRDRDAPGRQAHPAPTPSFLNAVLQ